MSNIMPDKIEERLNRASRELDVLYDISRAMRTTLDLEHILYIILTGVTSHSGLGYNRALLYLPNSQKRQLECKMAIGPESGEDAGHIWQYIENCRQQLDDLIQPEKIQTTLDHSHLYRSLKELRFPLDQTPHSLLSGAFNRGVPWHLTPEEIQEYSKQDPLLQIFKTHDLIIMPLRAKDHINGLIVADNFFTQKPITSDDIKFFTMLADQAGLAIENSKLYEMVVHKSHTDPVTDLWNHGFFQERLSAELKHAKEQNAALSLAVIDIDNFKQLNDNYGHQHGDYILRELGQLLKYSSRDIDYVCRYGGEEFSIILKQTTRDQCYEIAERIRQRIQNHSFGMNTSFSTPRITVSIGLAAYPDDALSKEELIAKADKAMYIAKFSGKNQTCVS